MEYPPTVYASSKDFPEYFNLHPECCHVVDVLLLPEHLASEIQGDLPQVICHRTQSSLFGQESQAFLADHIATWSPPRVNETTDPGDA